MNKRVRGSGMKYSGGCQFGRYEEGRGELVQGKDDESGVGT